MNISARLILILTATVSVVMTVAGFLTIREREANLTSAARLEVQAHALTLQIALEEDYRTGRMLDAQQLINRLGQNPGIYGVLLFNERGEVEIVSDALRANEIKNVEEVKQVIASGQPIEHVRRLSGQDVFSIILPLRADNHIVGAMEIAQPISFVEAHVTRVRRHTTITTILLCLAIFIAVWLVMKYNLAQPMQSLLGGAVALGQGDLSYRVPTPRRSGEITLLAREFNRMADHLSDQRAAAARESEERLMLERKLRHSERLASVGRLAAGVAHEMGAPLQVIDGRAKQLLNQPEAPIETRQRNLTIIRAQSDRIANIVRQLLTLARPYNLRLRPVDLTELLTSTVELLETNAARAGIETTLKSEGRVIALGDSELLHQVFSNICFNALQAMPDGGRLSIECFYGKPTSDRVRQAVARICDTGPGIAPEHLPQIFDPFFTTKEVGSGAGLGLAVSSRIIEEHGGGIEATNRPEGGACFTVFLPCVNREDERASNDQKKPAKIKYLTV